MKHFLLTVIILILFGSDWVTRAQLSEEQEKELSTDEFYVNEFLKGFRMDEINPRIYSCLWEQNQMVKEADYMIQALTLDDPEMKAELFPHWQDQVYNVTQFISTPLSLTWYNCLNGVHDSYIWGLDYLVGFEDDVLYYSWPVSMLTTALEQIVYLTRLNMAMYEASEVADWQTFYMLLGRLMRTLLIIDPLPVESLDDVHDKAFGDDDFVIDESYDPYDGSEQDIDDYNNNNTYDPYANDSGDTVDWDDNFSGDDIGSLYTILKSVKDIKLGGSTPPDYIKADDMNIVYVILFIIEGFGSQTVGFSSTYYATQCGEIAWGIFESMEKDTVPSVPNEEYEKFIDSTTFQLREIDPLFKHCFQTGNDYENAIMNYGMAFDDQAKLGFNILYHAVKLYENTMAIIEKFEMGFDGQDSAFYQRMGRNFGLTIFWMFYDADDFEWPDIQVAFPRDFDEEIELDWDFDSMV